MSSRSNDCRIYVGNLPPDIRTRELDDIFDKFGNIEYVDLKNRDRRGRGPPFAFVEFADPLDAEDAVASRDGYNYDGYKLRVEFPRGRARAGSSPSSSGGWRRDGRNRGAPGRHSQYRVKVSGIPRSGSWQDLKDHMREAGDVCFADVYRDGSGVVEFLRYDDMKYAIKWLDDTKFRTHEGDISYIRVKEDYDYRGRSRSKSFSPARGRRRSPSCSPRWSSSRSSSRSRSHSYERR